ncbi:MAG: hypothetical protein HYX27_14780 [Acidobacteria bacterium]|nr:hypothetical protein [Acidobacteriota bacterium]
MYVFLFLLVLAVQAQPKYPALPSETPQQLTIPKDAFQYTRQYVMIPMRVT